MITFSKFGRHGRIGNQLFQYAAMIGFSKKYHQDLVLPDWKYSHYFNKVMPANIQLKDAILHNERSFHYEDQDRYSHVDFDKAKEIDMHGYFQSPKYWQHCEKDVRSALNFIGWFIDHSKKGLESAFKKRTIAVHIRRGDYIDNPNYILLPLLYYIYALDKNLHDWRDCNLIIFSDDIEYCKIHFKCLDNVFFSEGKSDIEDLCLMAQCDDFVISNSSYSWWGAYLGKAKDKRVVRPAHHFAGNLKATCDIKDLYPAEWICFNYEGLKIDLQDVTFTIPVQYDHLDRKKNLDLSVCMLQHYFNTKIIVMENIPKNQTARFEYMEDHCNYTQCCNNKFHRTKMLNEMAYMSNTELIVNWDADVIISPLQVFESVVKIRNKRADMVYPYDGTFARLPRESWFKEIAKRLDIGFVRNTFFKGMEKDATVSVGGAVIFNKEAFIKGGMENENFVSFGPEDVERIIRFKTLGFKIERIKGALYHMNHYVGPNSSNKHPNVHSNRAEFAKIDAMGKKELQAYIKTWNWL